MEELLKNEVVRKKIKSLSPAIRREFIENLLDLYEQETEDMIDVIEESRLELRGDFISFTDETKALRAESRMLEDKRKEYEDEQVERYLRQKGMASRNSDSRLSYLDERSNNKAVKDYTKRRGKRGVLLADEIRSQSSSSGTSSRAGGAMSSMSTRSLPTPVLAKTVEEEKDAVMKNLSTANQQKESERQRQVELIEQRREQRKQQKRSTEEKALELLEKALERDRQLAEKKKEQDQKLKERLEDIKRKKEKNKLLSDKPEEKLYSFEKY